MDKIDLAERAAQFWSASVRSAHETAKNLKQEQALAESEVTNVGVAGRALTIEIKARSPSTPAELDAHIAAVEARKSAVVESMESLRRAIGSTQVLEARFSAELSATVDDVRAKLTASCTRYLVTLREIAREWNRFSGQAAGVTSDKVATVQQELAQLDARKAAVAGRATSTGERLIRETEVKYKQALESIDASAASTFVSRPYQYWGILIALAVGAALAAGFFSAGAFSRILAALIVAGAAGCVLWSLDNSIKRTHAESKASLRSLAESARSEGIRRVSREQEELVRTEIEKIGADARRLQLKLDEAIVALSEGRERAQQTARDLAAQERSKLEQSWVSLEGIATEVTKIFQTRHAKAIDAASQALRERLRSGVRKSQAEVDDAVACQIEEPTSKCKIGSRDIPSPGELRSYLEVGSLIRVPLVVDLMESCCLKHDSSPQALDVARRLASLHTLEIRKRTGAARVTIFDSAGLGAGYSELLSIAADDGDVSLLAANRDVSERLSQLVRTAAARNRALAVSREIDWMTRRTKAGSFSEPAEVLVLEVPRAGLGSEQRAQIEALLGVGRSAGVILIVLEAKDRSEGREILSGSAREVEILGAAAFATGYSLDIPSKNELASKAEAILAVASDKTLKTGTLATPAGPPSSSFAEFIGVVVPRDSRWRSEVANTDENLAIPIGVTDNGDVASLVFDDGAPHALLLGGTGSGKTNFLHTLIQSACIKYSPDELRLYLADLKSGVSFEPYARLDSLGSHFGAVACTSSVVFGAVLIDAAKQEMQKRYDAFKLVQRRVGESIKGLAHYRKLAGPSDEKLPRLLVIIDEFQALFDDAARRRQTLEHLVALLKQGRQVGVHVMLATQSLRGKAGDLDQALSQMHTRMILPAAMSDATSIFRSMPLSHQAVDYCNMPGKCFMSRDFGEKGGIGFTNPESKDNSYFFSTLETLTKDSPPPGNLVPIVWTDEVGSLRDNFQFRTTHESKAQWYLGVPYSAHHALTVPLENAITTVAVAVEERGQARALVGSLLMSLLTPFEGIDVFWVDQQKDSGPLRQREFDAMAQALGLNAVRHLDSMRSLATALCLPDSDVNSRPQVAIVPDATLLSNKPRTAAASDIDRLSSFARTGFSDASPDIDLLISMTSHRTKFPKIVLLLAASCHDLMDGASRAAVDLADIRIAGGRVKGSRLREFLKVGDLPEMTDDDLVVTTEQNRRPMIFRPFEEHWRL